MVRSLISPLYVLHEFACNALFIYVLRSTFCHNHLFGKFLLNQHILQFCMGNSENFFLKHLAFYKSTFSNHDNKSYHNIKHTIMCCV